MVIEVSEEDIRHGVPGNMCLCAVARACARATGRTDLAVGIVADHLTLFDRSRHVPVYVLPDDAQTFIRRFDMGLPVEPFSFEIPDLVLPKEAVA